MTIQKEAIAKLVDLCVNQPLYTKTAGAMDSTGNDRLSSLIMYDDFRLDLHCIECDMVTPFKTKRIYNHQSVLLDAYKKGLLKNGICSLDLHCQRNETHLYSYIFRVGIGTIEKIGQIPTLEDIALTDLKRFRPVLDKEDFTELHRAGGLASHGIGIGSFVYLRRIFERLIKRHYDEFVESNGAIDRFETLRMDEKIDALKSILPDVLVEHKAIYSILSRGIHELDEETCKKYFPIVKSAIIAILEEDLQALEKSKAAEQLKNSLAAILSEGIGKAKA